MSDMSESASAFSVVIRCFNRRDRVLDAIDSVLRQTDQDFEVIVVDDASTDGSRDQVAARYGSDARVRIIQHPENQGAGAAANTGVDAARGGLIAFLDSDDTYLPDCLAGHRAALDAAPQAAMSYCDYIQVWDPYGLERVIACGTDDQDQRLATLKGGFIHSQSLTVVRRDAFDLIGGFDATLSISHDFDLWMRLALSLDRPFVQVRRPLVRYALSADGVTKRYDQWWQEAKEVLGRGRRHPAAMPYLSRLIDVDKKVGGNIIARRGVEHWIGQIRPQRVSVVIPALFPEKVLMGAVRSVQEQTVSDLEILLVANSAFGPAARAVRTTLGDDRLTLVEISGDIGLGEALLKGMRLAGAPLVAPLDPRDRWHPAYLEEQLRANSFPAEMPVFTYADGCVAGPDGDPAPLPHEHLWPATDPRQEFDRMPYPNGVSCLAMRSELVPSVTRATGQDVLTGADIAAACLGHMAPPDDPGGLRGSPVRIARPLVTFAPETVLADGC